MASSWHPHHIHEGRSHQSNSHEGFQSTILTRGENTRPKRKKEKRNGYCARRKSYSCHYSRVVRIANRRGENEVTELQGDRRATDVDLNRHSAVVFQGRKATHTTPLKLL